MCRVKGVGSMQSVVGRVMCRGSECGGPWASATCDGRTLELLQLFFERL